MEKEIEEPKVIKTRYTIINKNGFEEEWEETLIPTKLDEMRKK